jgi:hypothetical protein
MEAIFLLAVLACSIVRAPRITIFPDLNTRAVTFGSLMRMRTPGNLTGLYSVFLQLTVIKGRLSSLTPSIVILQVATMLVNLSLLNKFPEEEDY